MAETPYETFSAHNVWCRSHLWCWYLCSHTLNLENLIQSLNNYSVLVTEKEVLDTDMRIIQKDPSEIILTIILVIITIGIGLLLFQMTGEVEELKKSWDEMSCAELKRFSQSDEYEELGYSERQKFQRTLESCSNK